jgi:plastocyanin
MLSNTTLASALLLVLGSAYAQTVHEVTATDGVTFDPDTLEDVAKGDTIRVTFSQSNSHNILSGSWDEPCTYNSDIGVNSGVHSAGEVFTFQVNSTDPEIYFCSVRQHCQHGMALVVNPR